MSKDRFYTNLKVGDTVEILDTEDIDLLEWLTENDITTLTISASCEESELIWAVNCPYAVSMSDVCKVSEQGNKLVEGDRENMLKEKWLKDNEVTVFDDRKDWDRAVDGQTGKSFTYSNNQQSLGE